MCIFSHSATERCVTVTCHVTIAQTHVSHKARKNILISYGNELHLDAHTYIMVEVFMEKLGCLDTSLNLTLPMPKLLSSKAQGCKDF